MYAGAFPKSSSSFPGNDYFSNASRWRDNQNTKIHPRSPDFLYTITPKSLSGLDNPYRFQEELHRRRCLPSVKKVEDGELCNKVREEQKIHYKSSSKEKEQHLVLSPAGIGKHEKSQDVTDTAVTLVALLKACKELHRGSRVHADIVKSAFLENNVFVGSTLISMYAKCGALDKAQVVFDELPILNVVSWNALIAGYVQHGHGKKALYCFECMNLEGCYPDEFTFSCILKACGDIQARDKGQRVHVQIVREHLFENNIHVGTALVDMYAKCGALERAQAVFDELPAPNIVSWNVLIGGYAQHGHGEEALNCYRRMQLGGFPPHPITFACVLKACGGIGASDKGQEIHSEILRDGLLEENVVVGNALIDMYAKCGALEKAQEVFDKLLVWDVVSWNVLIGGYALCGHGGRALECFEQMQLEGFFSPDAVTFAYILRACGSIGAAYKGQELHSEVAKQGLLEKARVIDMALVDMYADCGMLAEAQELFNKLQARDVLSWSALMVGYAQLGKDEAVFNLFNTMIREGTEPDMVTFTIVLKTCSHGGRLNEGELYFETISKDYGNIPILDHHTCMIDLFSRAGRLDKAVAVIEEMPFSANYKLWDTLLGACQIWGNLKVGRWAFQHAVHLDEKLASAYVGMRNIYTASLRQD